MAKSVLCRLGFLSWVLWAVAMQGAVLQEDSCKVLGALHQVKQTQSQPGEGWCPAVAAGVPKERPELTISQSRSTTPQMEFLANIWNQQEPLITGF